MARVHPLTRARPNAQRKPRAISRNCTGCVVEALQAVGLGHTCAADESQAVRRRVERLRFCANTDQALSSGSGEALSGRLGGGGCWASKPLFSQSSPKSSAGCRVATLPFPQSMASVGQYRSQPQQTRSGWAGFTGKRLLTA